MKSDRIKFGKMLKLIVASEFHRSKHWNFTVTFVTPALVLIFIPFRFLFQKAQLSTHIVLFLFILTLTIFHLILKKYAKKWRKENTHTLEKHAKKIFNYFLFLMIPYWGITILFLFILDRL